MTSKARKPRASGKGALVVVSSLLLGSAALRIGDGAGQALARAPEDFSAAKPAMSSAPMACETPEDMQHMLDVFRQREARLETQEAAMRARVQALAITDREVTQRLAILSQAEEQLRGTIALADSAAENDLTRLTKVYENMKPKQAAALFEEMNPEFAAGFLGRMRPEAAALIMAGLSPEAAHTFSVVLAGRNATVPSE